MADPDILLDEDSEMSNLSDTVVTLLGRAQNERNAAQRLIALRDAQNIIIHKDPTLLDNFLDEMLAFMNDPMPSVRQFVAEFIEEACAKEMDILPTVLPNLTYLFASDHHVAVQKRIILATAHMYPHLLKWVTKLKTGPPQMQNAWEQFTQMKHKIRDMIDTDNDGIRNFTIKFYETCILCQSPCTEQSAAVLPEFNLKMVPRDHRFVSFKQLESEAKQMSRKLLELMASPTITSLNLMTCMASLVTIVRGRPENMFGKLVLAFETLHVNLPPTLAKSQVISVRKALKMHLLSMLRHEAAGEYQPQITTLLTDLGATQTQILKALPAESEMRKRMKSRKSGQQGREKEEPVPKKQKPEKDDDSGDEDEEEKEADSPEVMENRQQQQAIETTSVFLYEKLTPNNVTDLVMLALMVLPSQPPPAFQSSYTPIAAAGTEAQKRHLARLMANQLTAAGIGPGAQLLAVAASLNAAKNAITTTSNDQTAGTSGQSLITTQGLTNKEEMLMASVQMDMIEKKLATKTPQMTDQVVLGVQSSKQPSKRLHQKGLAHITQPLTPEQRMHMLTAAYTRIIAAEHTDSDTVALLLVFSSVAPARRALQGGAHSCQQQILVRLIARLQIDHLSATLRSYILADQKNRADLAVIWLYEQYAVYLDLTKGYACDESESFDRYDLCLCRLLNELFKRGEHKESLFHKLLLEAPLITPNAIVILKQACLDPVYGTFGMNTLREMILTRPRQRHELLCALLDFVVYENLEVRRQALNSAKELYQLTYMKADVKEFVMRNAHYLLDASPPTMLYGTDRGRLEVQEKWDESSIKACVRLLIYLLPTDPSLIHDLATVYVRVTSNDIRLALMRMLEAPIKAIGMQSPELLRLVETCPAGAEALVMKMVHLLTERSAPTRELVEKVCEMHRVRMPDVRILVPVITGLTRAEIVSALPKLIKLSPNVLREVFNRLLYAKSLGISAPMQPVELMVALHQLPTPKSDLKAVITAVNELLKMRTLYTKEVMADVIQKLLDADRLPHLFMRTVIQVLAMFPSLQGFVINVLQRLIVKRVWENEPLWDGFVRCCDKCRPQSYQVLLGLPTDQLRLVFKHSVGGPLRRDLLTHLEQLPVNQQQLIPHAIMNLVRQHPDEQSTDGDTTVQLDNSADSTAAPLVQSDSDVVMVEESGSAIATVGSSNTSIVPLTEATESSELVDEPPCEKVVNIPEGDKASTDEEDSGDIGIPGLDS